MVKEFTEICQKTRNRHAPAEQKFVWGNHLPFMTKTSSKAIMHRTTSCNEYLRNKTNNKTNKNKRKYTKQRNYCLTSKKIKETILQ